MCGRKGPGARTRGRRRHPRKLGGTPPRSPGGARAAEETAYPLAPRSPRGSRWGRWSEGVLTRPKPQAARYPRRSAARPRKHARTCQGGLGGCAPLAYRLATRGTPSCPSPPAICGRGQRRLAGGPGHLRRYPAAWPAAGSAAPCRPAKREAGLSPAVQAGRLGRRPPRSSCWPAAMTREHNGRAGKEACLPRAIPRGVQADAGAQCPPLSCGVRPGRDGLRGGNATNRRKVALATAVIETQNAAALSPAAILPPCAASGVLLRAQPDTGAVSPAAILRRRHRREGADPFPRPLSCGRGGGDRVCGLF